MHRYQISWSNKNKFDLDKNERLQLLRTELCVDYEFVPEKSSASDITVELQFDERLVAGDKTVLIKAKGKQQGEKRCVYIERTVKVQAKLDQLCRNDPIKIKVVKVSLAKNNGFGLDYGCTNKLPTLSIPLPDAENQRPKIAMTVSKNVDTIKATAGARRKVQYDIELKVTNEDNLRHPYLLVDYGDDVQVDKASIELENWEMTACPGENSQCSTDNQDRKCLRKNIGASLSKDVKLIKEKLFLTLLATGEKNSIDVNVQMYSCSACNKVVLSCNGKKCKKFTSRVEVIADELVNEKDVKLSMIKDRIEYSTDTNEVLSSSIDIEYTVKITGQTPVKSGDFQVDFSPDFSLDFSSSVVLAS